MSLADETPPDNQDGKRISKAQLATDRFLNRALALQGAAIRRYLDNGLTGKITVELFFRDGHLPEPGIVNERVTCKA